MSSLRPGAIRALAAIASCAVILSTGRVCAQGFAGQLSYTGSKGPIGKSRPLCLCVYTDANLTQGIGCLKFTTNPAHYNLNTLNRGQFYLRGFVDIHVNDTYDPDEPYQIYNSRAAPPADPVSGTSGATNIDLVFGDENLPGTPTSTPTVTAVPTSTPPAPSATPSPTWTARPTIPRTPRALPGDCNANGVVTIDELERAVAIALERLDPPECPPADINRDGAVSTDELILVLDAALGR